MITDTIYRLLTKLIKTRAYSAWQMLLFGDLEYRLYRDMQFLISTAHLHQQTFTRFKNINVGKEVAIIACGPSVKNYVPIPGVVNIGVNRSLYSDKFNLDYWFMEDLLNSTREERDFYNAYKGNNCIKFYGMSDIEDMRIPYDYLVPPEIESVRGKALRYRHDFGNGIKGWEAEMAYDISTEPLAHFGSVVFSAVQFALWTNPKRIFLIGCDCTDVGHFYNEKKEKTCLNTEIILNGYNKLKKFVACYYPQLEIISVNPVGLRGLFRDWDQDKGPLDD